MPRCDVALTDGVYTNATVVVEDGCIISIEQGTAPLYAPDNCCATPGGGGSGDAGVDGEQGPPGENATIEVGTVTSLPPGSTPTVENVGTSTNAVFNFGIPRGEQGEDATPEDGATSTDGGINLENGIIKTPLPLTWPPVLTLQFEATDVLGVVLGVAKDDTTGAVTLTVDLSGLYDMLDSRIEALETAADSTAIELADHEARITALEGA